MKKYNSNFYNYPIEVDNIWWEIIVTITTENKQKVIYSWYDVTEKTSYSPYINKCLLWSFIKHIPKNVLILWLWAWSFSKFLEDHIKNISITWIEIDETMVEIAKNEMKIKTHNIIIWDCFTVLDDLISENKTFDVILFDCYWVNSEIPENLMSENFLEKCKKVLLSDWIFSINMANYLENREKYNILENNLKQIFTPNHDLLLSWKNDFWNVVWIFNLDKNYKAQDYTKSYQKNVELWNILENTEIINNTYVYNKH